MTRIATATATATALAALVAVFSCLAPAAAPAAAQGPACAARSDVIAHLGGKYGERPVSVGLADNGAVVEVLKSRRGKTWTIIVTLPDGTSCLAAAGENWQDVPVKPQTGPRT